MNNAMPPLGALRAFEAAARHLSFTAAAGELNVTPGALSHQIRALEAFLGVRLFERSTRSVALTVHGKRLYPGLQAGFGLVRDAVAGLRADGDSRVLVVSTPPGLTSKWLVPRLYRFAEAHPDIDLRISASVHNVSLTADGIDAAIRSLPADSVEDHLLVCEKLMDVTLVAVCSPRLAARFGPLDAPGVLPRLPLIHDDTLTGRPEVPTWADWVREIGLEGGDLTRGLHFNSSDHAMEAALEGAGLLLAHAVHAGGDLRSGRLLAPFDVALSSGRAYYFVCPRDKEKRRAVQAFRAWLRDQAAGGNA